MVLDIDGSIAGTIRRGYQEVGFTDPPAAVVGGQASADDYGSPGPYCGERRVLPFVSVVSVVSVAGRDYVRRRMQGKQTGNDRRLELAAAGELALKERRGRQRGARLDDVPLDSDRAPLGDITALRRHF